MAQASATWSNTETAEFEPADLVRVDYMLKVLERIEHIAQNHDHDITTPNMGGALILNEPEEILFRLGAA